MAEEQQDQERKELTMQDPFSKPDVTRRENFDAEEAAAREDREAARDAQRQEHNDRVSNLSSSAPDVPVEDAEQPEQ